jgi:hypothetical protein
VVEAVEITTLAVVVEVVIAHSPLNLYLLVLPIQ